MRWIIGDIHGMYRPLTVLLELVGQKDSAPTLFFAGDYINRGPDSCKVMDLLVSLENATCIRGNHDDIFDLVLHHESYAEDASEEWAMQAFQWFYKHGMDTTFHSYGFDWQWLAATAHKPTPARMKSLADAVPARHKQFVRHLPPIVEFDDIFILHGKWDADTTSEKPGIHERLQNDRMLRHHVLWGRYSEEEILRPKPWKRMGFFGHTPVSNYTAIQEIGRPIPMAGPNIVLLDTACALDPRGRLTAWCVEEHRFVQVDHHGIPVKEGH